MPDRLISKIQKMGNPTVVGLDPTYEMIPAKIKNEMLEKYGKTPQAAAEMFIAFNKGLIDSLYDIVPAVKPQIAMYEKYGFYGIRAYIETTAYAKEKGMFVIGDIKRGDISSTAEAYAAHLAGAEIEGDRFDIWNTDAVTLNPYMGFDAIKPFLNACTEKDKCVFILVKTSNQSSVDFQDVAVQGGSEGGSSLLYETVAKHVKMWGESVMGKNGYSKICAVVGATSGTGAASANYRARLRELMPNTFFLIPGYGAQGGTAADIREMFDKDGGGCIINSSRGIIAAYKKNDKFGEDNFADAARAAALEMKEDLCGI